MEDFIYLEVDEEITSVIDRLKGSESDKVGIVVPRGAMVLQSVVNLKLIQKAAQKAKKTVAIITVDKVGRSLAAQVGLPVYDDPRQAEASSPSPSEPSPVVSDVIEIDMSKGEEEGDALPEGVKVNYYTGESVEGEAKAVPEKQESTIEKASKDAGFSARKVAGGATQKFVVKNKAPKDPRKLKLKIWISITAVLLAAVGAWLFLNKASVTVTVPAESYDATGEILVDATLMASEPENGKIKGTLVSAEEEVSKEINSTGTKKVGEKATGKITFYNDDGVDYTISSGTAVTASSGQGFVTTSQITVPKAVIASGAVVQGSIEGSIEADESGTEYNLSSSTTYAVSGANYISGKGETSGGTSEEIKVVSEEDITNAEDALVEEAPSKLRDKLKSDAKDEYVFESAINYEVNDFSANKSAGDESDTFVAKAKIVGQVLTFNEDDLREAIAYAVKDKLPEGQSLLESQEDVITPELITNDLPKKEMKINVKLATHVGNAVDTEDLAGQLKGKSVKNGRQIVADKVGVSVDDVSVKIRPSIGLLRFPFFAKRITFEFEYNPNATDNEDTSS